MSSINDALIAQITGSKPVISTEVPVTSEIESPILEQPVEEVVVQSPVAISTQVINEIQTILLNFKAHLPAFETMQATNPDAYEALTQIIMVMISLSQIMIESGQLKDKPELGPTSPNHPPVDALTDPNNDVNSTLYNQLPPVVTNG